MLFSIIAALEDHHYLNLLFILIFVLIPNNHLPRVISESTTVSTTSCSSSKELQIRFPFQLHRQYPGRRQSGGNFNLLCNYSTGEKQKENDDVILQLPAGSGGDFIVRSISYSSKEVEISDPLFCLPRKLLQFNVDALLKQTPYYGDYHYSFQLYNCSSSAPLKTRRLSSCQYGVIDCLSGDDYRAIVVMSSSCSLVVQQYCSFIGNVTFATTREGLTPYKFSRQRSLYLKWVDPEAASHDDYRPERQLRERLANEHYKGGGDQHMQTQMKYYDSYYYYPSPPPDRFYYYDYPPPDPYYYYYSPPYSYNSYTPSPKSSSSSSTIVAGICFAIVIPMVMVLVCLCVIRFRMQSDSINTQNTNPATEVRAAFSRVRGLTAINGSSPPPSSQQAATTTPATDVTPGLDQSVIDTFPTLIIQGEDKWLARLDDKTCSICLSEYELHDVLKILPGCLHKFHGECVDEWLRSKGVCPICRTALPKR